MTQKIAIKRFDFSNLKWRERAFEIRRKVFVEEQEVDEREEFDEFEASSIHYLAFVEEKAVGTSRWRKTASGIKFERFAVLRDYRKLGVGDRILKEMLTEFSAASESIYMHAQSNVIPFYEKNGFKATGNEFMECDIKHYKMIFKKTMDEQLTLKRAIDHVGKFHDAFGIGNESAPKASIDEKDFSLRFRLMKEENEEYLEAAKNGDLVEIADAIGDMLYILCGTILKHGLQDQLAEVFEEIQRSNMSKLDKDGNPIYREDGKVLKSDQYFKPNIASILEKHLKIER